MEAQILFFKLAKEQKITKNKARAKVRLANLTAEDLESLPNLKTYDLISEKFTKLASQNNIIAK